MKPKHKPSSARSIAVLILTLLIGLSFTIAADRVNAVAILPATDSIQMHISGNNLSSKAPVINAAPVITLNGSSSVSYTVGGTYSELGASCTDAQDGSIAVSAPTFNPALNMAAAGTYVATYTCTDSGSLTDTATRTVYVNAEAGVLAFTNSSSLIDASPHINQAFYAGMPDVNGDGCFDLYIGAHEDVYDSNMLIQDNVGGVCQGTFSHFPDNDNYSQASPLTPRITSRYIWGNFYDHPLGMWSFYGADVDGSASARYVLDPAFTTVGGQPQYLTKSMGCHGVRPKCIPADVDGDGQLEMVSRLYQEPYNTGYVVDIDTGANKFIPTSNSNTFTQGLTVFDLDNDGYVEFVQIEQAGYYKFNPVDSTLNWNAAKITNPLVPDGADRHSVVIDYDLDGDLDMIQVHVPYNTTDPVGGIPYLWRNNGDGTFTDVSATAFASMPTIPIYTGASSYANSQVADLDLDGYPDMVFMLENYNNAITVIRNNGNGTFSKTNSLGVDVTPFNWGNNSDRPWIGSGDFDNDGLIDLVHNGDNAEGAVAQGVLLKNITTTDNHWLRVRVRGSGSNTDGMHARISFFEPGTTNLVSYYHTGVFTMGYSNLVTHAGLGANATVDLRVEYPHGGAVCNFANVAANKDVIVFPTCNIQDYTPGSAIPLTYVASVDVNTTMTLVADAAVTPTTTELVTFALPFAQGKVTDLSQIKVSIGATEVAAYVEQGMTWWADSSIRSATIQLQNVNMTTGNTTVNVTDEGATVARLTEQAHSTGWTSAGANKNNLPYPRIFALHDKQYLADSGLIPPYDPAPDIEDAFESYQVAQFNNNFGGLDYSTSTNANWLFDRSSAMFKAYMTTGRVEFLKEAFLSKQFYFTYVRNDGTAPTQAGGDGCWTYGTTACADGKYIAPQQAKLALALTGDNSQWDNSLLVEMALQADLGWNQDGTRDPYDSELESFTERAAGLVGLAEVVVWEMTGDATVLANMNERIASLKDMQQTEKAWDTANGWVPKSGAWTHSMIEHEQVCTEALCTAGNSDDRGFSAWMTENIIDFLWHAYHATGHVDAPEMIRLAGNAVENYGFTTNYDTVTDIYTRRTAFTGADRVRACNTTGANTDILYLASAYASDTQVASNDWWPYYSDTHNIETVFTLATAYKFETDLVRKEKLASRINQLETGWVNASCATVFLDIYRLFNWQHRSNSIRTWERIQREDV